MLRILRGGQRWLTALFVIGVGGGFIFFLGLGGPLRSGAGRGTVIQVGSYEFGVSEFERERSRREAQYQEALGANYDPEALSDTLVDLTAQSLVERALLALEAGDLGLRVTTPEIEQVVLRSPLFLDANGRFDKQRFVDYAEYEYGNQRNFMEEQRIALLSQKMVRLLWDHGHVSEAEALAAARQQLEEVSIAFTALDTRAAPAGFEVDEAALAAFFPDREAEARALYEKRASRYDQPEQVRARHILVSVPAGASEEQRKAARERIEEARQRIEAGEDFAVVAGEISEDPGSKDRGGDLGFFGRGQMVGPFEEIAFSLEPGQLSDPVQTDFGFHLIRVEEKKEAVHRPFEDVRDELAREVLEADAGAAAARALSDKLVEGVSAGRSLEDVAREQELTLERTGWLRRRPDGFVPGLGPAQDLLATAFSLQPGQSSSRVFEVGDKLAMVQVLERREPDETDVQKTADAIRDRILEQRRSGQAATWTNARREALYEKGALFVDLTPVRGS